MNTKIRSFLLQAPPDRPVFAQVVAHHTPGCRCGYKDGDLIAGPWLDRPSFEQAWATTASVGARYWASGSTDLVRLR